MGLQHVLWVAVGEAPSLQDGQEDLGSAVTGCGVDKGKVSGDFSRQANADKSSCCNSSHIGSENLFRSSEYTNFRFRTTNRSHISRKVLVHLFTGTFMFF